MGDQQLPFVHYRDWAGTKKTALLNFYVPGYLPIHAVPLAYFPCLRLLELRHCNAITVKNVQHVLSHCWRLERLSIQGPIWLFQKMEDFESLSSGNFGATPIAAGYTTLLGKLAPPTLVEFHMGTLPVRLAEYQDVEAVLRTAGARAGMEVAFRVCAVAEETCSEEEIAEADASEDGSSSEEDASEEEEFEDE
ncbi:hypothetical protein ACM66B_005579 [Microbotryomycetes sp. NB124-2]